MHARSALFDLFGDHLRSRGGTAPVAALVRLLAPVGVSASAVRTAVSRMVAQGWLEPVGAGADRGYALTARGLARLDDAAARIYRTPAPGWKGAWDLLVVPGPRERATRARLRSALGFLGYAELTPGTWISPRRSAEVAGLLAAEGVPLTRFEAYDTDPAALAARAWDLDRLAAAYTEWLGTARLLVRRPEAQLPVPDLRADERAFAVRSHLVHEWRKFLFVDPGLPAELLPSDWPGHEAAAFFDQEAARLQPAAEAFVDRCLDPRQTTQKPERP